MKQRPKNSFVAFDNRVRQLHGKSKGWIDTRIVTSEVRLIRQLTLQEWALYAFLCTVANSDGVSWYSLEKLSDFLHIGKDTIIKSRENLQKKGLISVVSAKELSGKYPDIDGRYVFYQVLELPIGQITIEVNRSVISAAIPRVNRMAVV